jgi:amino acid adenylation domain-containing protein/non-ribosomal peptide synthase protein (TIGR01720 family)
VGVKDNFFELGGHSLLATQLLAEVNKIYGTKIRLKNFFQDATPAGLAQLVEQTGVNRKETAGLVEELPQVTVDLENRYSPFPLTEMQQAQWLGRLGAFNMSNVAAHVYFENEKQGLDLEQLNKTWQFMLKRHEMLRTVLLPDGGQRILESPLPYQIKDLDLRNETPANAEEKLLMVRREMDHQVRPIDQWPLFEVRTTRLPGDIVRLHFSIDLLICDIGSLRMLMKEWAAVYENPGISLPELELSFRDYVLAEQKIKDTELYANAGRYWDKRVTELPPAPLLPLAVNPESIKNPHFKRWSMRVDKEAWNRLRTRGIQQGISPSIILLTAFAQVLANWSKSPNFCINTPIINRLPLHHQVEDIVGEFATFAPVEVNIDREIPLQQLAANIQERNWENLENRYLHGTTILRKLAQHKGEVSGAVMPVVFTSTIVHEVEGEEKFFQQFGDYVYVISQTPQVWLDHTVLEDELGLLLSWHAVDGLFPEGLVDTMWKSYEAFLHRLVEDEQAWNSHHWELTPAKQLELIKSINDTTEEIPAVLLQAPFFARASREPDEMAVITDEDQITYDQLADFSNRLGGAIRRMGVKPGQLVAVVMEKGWEQVVSIMGILQAGAAYLPVSPGLPKDRMEYILETGDVELILIQLKFDKKLTVPERVRQQIVSKESLARLKACQLEPTREPGDLAYIIYTSGSTGFPKGVMISHQAAQNTIMDMNRRFNINETDRVLALSELNFDLSVYDIFGILAVGGTLVIPRAHTTRDPRYWLDLVWKHRVTLWNSVPALMEMFVEFAESHPRGTGLPLRLAWLSGDWIPLRLPTRLHTLIPGIEVISLGGATEGSIWSICYPIKEVDPNWVSIPYGKPLANQQFHVLNENLEYCPVWVTGELYIGGAGVAMGYFKNEEQTAKSFITHPRTGEGLYRTGDLGRYLPDGNIEFLGREDFQVKISGFRIELEEIEAALNQHPAIQSAIVNALGESRDKKRLVGYIIFKEDKQVEIPGIRSFLREKLPDYMIPADFVELESFPLTSNGKVDRKALPEPRQTKVTTQEMAERSFLVDKLASIFAGVMGVEEECVDIHGNFFAMGGDSIMGIQAISKAAQEGLEISPDQLFRNPTIFDLAKVMEANYAGLVGKERFKGKVSLTPVQYWILDRYGYAAARSNWIILVKVSEPMDPELAETAFQCLVQQHDVLQLHYIEKGDSWEQEYHDSAVPAELDFVDVTGMTGEEFETTIENTRKELEDMQELEISPLVKLCLFHDQQNREPHFLLAANQLIMDFRSLDIFFEDFYTVYKKFAQDRNTQLIRKSPRFKEWAARIMDQARSQDIWEKDKKLWLSLPNQVPPLYLGDNPTLEKPGSTIEYQLDEDSTKALFQDALAIVRTPLEEFLLVALAFTFINEGKADALYVDWVMQPPEPFLKDLKMDKTPGNFNWTFPLLLKVNPGEKTGETIKIVKEQIRRYQERGESFGILYYLVNDGKGDNEIRELARPQVKFNCNRQTQKQEPVFMWTEVQTSFQRRTRHDSYILDINVIADDDKLKTTWNFDPRRCSYTVAEELAKGFLREIRSLAQYLQTCKKSVLCPGDFPEANLDQQELEKFLTAFSNS